MTSDNAAFQITLSKIYRAQGRFDEALTAINEALLSLPNSAEALDEKGRVLFSLGKYDDASTLYGEMMMDNPDTPMNYLLRGWVIYDGLKKSGDALSVYKRMADNATDDTKAKSMHGFALLFTGKKDEALKWMSDILRDTKDTDGSVNYLAACLFAQAGETDKAYECVENALGKGYANRYKLTLDNDARVNIAPLREGTRLTTIMANYSYIFE